MTPWKTQLPRTIHVLLERSPPCWIPSPVFCMGFNHCCPCFGWQRSGTKDVCSYWTPVITQMEKKEGTVSLPRPPSIRTGILWSCDSGIQISFMHSWMLWSYFYLAVLLRQERGKAQPLKEWYSPRTWHKLIRNNQVQDGRLVDFHWILSLNICSL